MKISLSPEIERLIAEKLKSGRFSSADEVVREGLELLSQHEKGGEGMAANGEMKLFAELGRIFAQLSEAEWEKIPRDLSKNLDHYLHGGGKSF